MGILTAAFLSDKRAQLLVNLRAAVIIVLLLHRICVFILSLNINCDYLTRRHEQAVLSNGDAPCLLRGGN